MKKPPPPKSKSQSPIYECLTPRPPPSAPPSLSALSEEEWAAAEAEQAKKAKEFAAERIRRDEVRRENLRTERRTLQNKLVEALASEDGGVILSEDFLSLASHNHREDDRCFYSHDPGRSTSLVPPPTSACPACFLRELKERGYWPDEDFRLVLQVELIPSDER